MLKALALAALALPLAVAGCSHRENMYYSAPPPPAYSDIAQRGFHDGFDAARHDMSRGWRPDVDRHDRFRNPPVPRRALEDYRHSFREGYQQAFHGDHRDWR
jgi:hypothetical protein